MSAPDAVVGVDLGTSAVKVGVHTFDGVRHAARSADLPLRRRGGGHVEQDLDDLYDAVGDASRRAVAASGIAPARIGALAVAGQMAGVGIVDADNRPLAPFDSWLDTRCGDVVARLSADLGDRITAAAGCAPTISIGPKMVWWLQHAPQVCARAASFVTATGYVAARAVGSPGYASFIDPSHLHFTAVADVGGGGWDAELVAATGIPERLLPRIVESASVIGHLDADGARHLGLAPGTPVAAGCGDTAAGALGANVTQPHQAFDLAGTAAVFGACVPSFTPDRATGGLLTMRAPLPGRWYSLAYVGDAGQVIEWACRELLGGRVEPDDAYAELAAVAATIEPGSDGVLVSPHVSGRVMPVAPHTRGTVVGLSPEHGHAHIARATLEAIAFEYRGYADHVRSLDPDHEVRTVTGTGGGSRSQVWNQIKSDVLGVPYTAASGVDAGTRGAAIVALAALGEPTPPLPDAAAPSCLPDPTTRAAYDAAYESYRWWTEHLVEGYRRRATMVRGPRTEEGP